MGKNWNNFKENNGLYDSNPQERNKNRVILLFIVILFLLAIIIGIKQHKKDEEIEKEYKTRYSYKCILSDKEIKNKIEALGFVQKYTSNYVKDKYEIDVYSSSIEISVDKEYLNIKELYSIANTFIEIDEEVFIKSFCHIIESLKESNDYRSKSITITKSPFEVELSGTSYNYKVRIYNCSYSNENSEYQTTIYNKESIINFDTWLIKKVYDVDLDYQDLINFMVQETMNNKETSRLKVKELIDLRVYESPTIYYEFNSGYQYYRIEFDITHSFDDYKEKLKKDFEYLEKYFNEKDINYISKLIKLIEDREYLSWEKEKNSYRGTYYHNGIRLDDNVNVYLYVYEDKISFDFDFKE